MGFSPQTVPSKKEQLAIYVSGSCVACVYTCSSDQLMTTMRCDVIHGLTEVKPMLEKQLQALQLPSSVLRGACNLVLAPEFYALHMLEKPDLPDDEVVDAVRWKLHDHVEFAVENASIDVFPVPASASRKGEMIFVVALPRQTLSDIVGQVCAAGVSLASVDISELALRNLAWRCFPQADQSVGFLRLTSNSGMLNISRGDDLYLARSISGVPDKLSEQAWSSFREGLLLQVQRSMDYYESSMSQPPCNALIVACTHSWTESVSEYLSEMLAMPVRTLAEVLSDELSLQLLNPEPVLIDWSQLDEHQANAISAAMPALGGSLRQQFECQERSAA